MAFQFMTSRRLRSSLAIVSIIPFSVLVFLFGEFSGSALGQESARKATYSAPEAGLGDRPSLRDQLGWNWNQRGRSVPRGSCSRASYRRGTCCRDAQDEGITCCLGRARTFMSALFLRHIFLFLRHGDGASCEVGSLRWAAVLFTAWTGDALRSTRVNGRGPECPRHTSLYEL